MPFGNPLDNTPSPQAAPQVPQPPAFRTWADAQIGQMSGGTAKSWDDLDAVFDALPAEPGKEKKDVAGQIKRDLLRSYTDSVLPQYYQDPKALNAAKAYAESQMAPHIMASAFKPLVAAAAAPAADKTAAQQDKFNELIERRDNAAESAKAAIHLDKLKRLNGQKYIKELGLADMDTDLAVEFIKSERDKRVAKSLEIEQQYAAGQVDHATAQSQLDQLYRESQNLEGAEFSLRDNAGWVESGAYLVGGIAKGLIAVPEVVARAYSGTVSGLSGDGFGKGWQEEASVGGFLGSLSEGVTEWQQDISKYDPEAVAQQYMMQAFDQGGMTAGLDVLRANPEVAWEMLSTSGVDSIATFFTGGLATKGARIAGNLIVDGGKALPRMLQAAPSLKAMKDVMVGATKAANTSRGANAAFTVGAVAVPSISAGLTDARESGAYMRAELDALSDEDFLKKEDVQAERAVWSTMDATRRAEYIANKKDDLVGQMMAEQTAVISAGLAASGYVGSKFGLEKFLLGSKAAAGVATKTATSSALKAAGVQGVLGGGLEMGEEVGETRAQHLFVNSYLDRDTEAPTPFDNYAGAAVSGFIVGGPLDAVGGYMQAKKENKAAADLKKTQEANAAFAAASGQVTEKDLKAARDAENKRKAGITAEVMSQIAAENAARAKSDATPQTWTGGSFVDKDGSIVTKDAQKFTDAELEDTEIQGRIDAAFAEFNKDDDPYSAMAILTAPDGMGLTGKQRSDLEVVYRIASDPKETDKVLQYRAKVEVLAMTNRIRLSELGKQSRDIRDKALGARRAQMPPTNPRQVAGLLPAPPLVYAPAEPNITPPLRLEQSPTYYPMADASFAEAEWSQELPQFQDQLTGGIEYGEAPEFYTEVYEVLGLPPPPREPIDTRGVDGLQNFPQDQFAARRNQQIDFPIVDAQWESDPLADVTDGGYTAQKQQFFDALENAYYAAQEQQAAQQATAAQERQAEEITPLPSESRTAIALAAGIPAARATVTVAASTNEDSTLGVQVVAYEDGSMGVIMSGDADGAVRIHTMEIDAVVDAVTKTTGNNDPLNATQLALNAITNRIKQTGVKTKGLIPAIRLAVANAVMRKVDSAAFAGKSKKAKAKQAATMLFLQRTIEEDRARVLDGSGRTALEYVTGIRDTLPKKHQANAAILDAARIKWHETDALLRKTGLYNTLDAAGHKVGVGKPKPAAEVMPIQDAVELDVSQTAALAANDAADAIVAGGSITVEQGAAIVDAVNTIASPDGLESLSAPSPTMVADRAIKDAIAAYESDPRTLRWKELKTREDRIIREGGLLPPRTDQEQSDSAWTKAERARIARMQINATNNDGLEAPMPAPPPRIPNVAVTAQQEAEAAKLLHDYSNPVSTPYAAAALDAIPRGRVPIFHGTSSVFDTFSDSHLLSATGGLWEGNGHYFSLSVAQAYGYMDNTLAESVPRDGVVGGRGRLRGGYIDTRTAALWDYPLAKQPTSVIRGVTAAATKVLQVAKDRNIQSAAQQRALVMALSDSSSTFRTVYSLMVEALTPDIHTTAVRSPKPGSKGAYDGGSARVVSKLLDATGVRGHIAVGIAGRVPYYVAYTGRQADAITSSAVSRTEYDSFVQSAVADMDANIARLETGLGDGTISYEDANAASEGIWYVKKAYTESTKLITSLRAERTQEVPAAIIDVLDELVASPTSEEPASALRAARDAVRNAIDQYTRAAGDGDITDTRMLVLGNKQGWIKGVEPFLTPSTAVLAKAIDSAARTLFGVDTAVILAPEVFNSKQQPVAGLYMRDNTVRAALVYPDGRTPVPAATVATSIVHEQMHRVTAPVYQYGKLVHEILGDDPIETLSVEQRVALDFYRATEAALSDAKAVIKRYGFADSIQLMYGFNDGAEFLAETASDSFRHLLNTLQVGKESVLTRVVRAIAKMLGVNRGSALEQTMAAIGIMWASVARHDLGAFYHAAMMKHADSVARAAKYGLGSEEFDAYIAASLEDVPINSTLWSTINDPMDGC